ncbi:MAG TPA: cytochrome c [Caulobacteraceae bacterium]|nr:cytochrome c [Caulobacteraceae bacterium]
MKPLPPPGRWPWPVHWLLAWAVAATVALAAAAAVVELGLYDVRATTPHDPALAWTIHSAMIHSVRLRAGHSSFGPVDPEEAAEGFRVYDAHCALCHGGPSVDRADWVSGMTPTPPYLLDASRRWTPAQLHFIISGGVKMTSMPAWRSTLSDRQIWSLVSFLEVLPYISGDRYQRMQAAVALPTLARRR